MAETNEITRRYREAQKLSLRGFADEINKRLINTGVSHSLVARWEREQNFYEPDLQLLFECLATYQGKWIAEWSRDCLQSMFPDLFQSGVVRVQLPFAE